MTDDIFGGLFDIDGDGTTDSFEGFMEYKFLMGELVENQPGTVTGADEDEDDYDPILDGCGDCSDNEDAGEDADEDGEADGE